MKGRHRRSRKDQHWVPRRDRLDIDEGEESDAIDTFTGADNDDLDRYKPGGDLYSDKEVKAEDLV